MRFATLTILAALGLAGFVIAQGSTQIAIHVPFAFEAGEKTFPAGEYIVHTAS